MRVCTGHPCVNRYRELNIMNSQSNKAPVTRDLQKANLTFFSDILSAAPGMQCYPIVPTGEQVLRTFGISPASLTTLSGITED